MFYVCEVVFFDKINLFYIYVSNCLNFLSFKVGIDVVCIDYEGVFFYEGEVFCFLNVLRFFYRFL